MSKPIDLQLHARLAIIYFLVAAILGLVLRLIPVTDIIVNYKFILHTHSHIALLGWLYLAVTTLLYDRYLKSRGLDGAYRKLYIFTQITILGMLFTFPFMGYALYSIIFSTLFLFASYWFTAFFLKNAEPSVCKSPAFVCLRWALIYLVLSSLGPWALGAIMNTLGSQSPWYRFSIYFYLHFLYNGWGILSLFGLVFYLFEQKGSEVSRASFNKFFIWLNASILLTFFISIIWMEPSFTFYCLSVAGVLAQWVAFAVFIKMADRQVPVLKVRLSSMTAVLLMITGLLFGGKLILQTLVAIPVLTDLTFKLTDLVIGFLHWVFLGVLTIGLFTFLHHFKLLRIEKTSFVIYLAGFALTELLLFYRAFANWRQLAVFESFLIVLTIGYASLVAAVLWVAISNYRRPHIEY